MARYESTLYPYNILHVDYLTGREQSAGSSGQFVLTIEANAYGRTITSLVTFLGARVIFQGARPQGYPSSKKLTEDNLYVYLYSAETFVSGGTPSPSQQSFRFAVSPEAFSRISAISEYLSGGDYPYGWVAFPCRELAESVYLGMDAIGFKGAVAQNVSYNAIYDTGFYTGYVGHESLMPYRRIVWEDIVPSLGGFSPTGGAYVNRAAAKTFTFTVNVENAYDGTYIGRTTTFRWRVQGSSTTHTLSVSGQSVTVPANTFPAQSTIEWRVECVTEHGISTIGPWQTITTSDLAPLAPTNLSPQNVFLYNNEDNVFSWQHNSPTGTAQTKADLQISSDGTTWSTLATVQGSTQQKTIAAGTIGAGTKFWRVRTYNTDNVSGTWSDAAQIVLIGAPVAPSIEQLITSPRAYVKWASGDQIGWRVTFTDSTGKVFDSGEQYGDTVKEYQAEGFLADGQAHYAVAVANEYGWSSTEGDFTVANDPSGAITLSAQEETGEAILSWAVTGSFDDLYVLRGGVPIAKVTGLNEYRDRAANGQETYQILGTVDGDYTLSGEAEVSVRVETMSIFDVLNGGETVQLRLKRSEAPVVARSKASNVSFYYFAGQQLPTAYTDGAASGALSISVTLRREHANELDRFFGQLCCLRDKTGWRGYGVLERIGHSIDRLDDVVLDFALTNYSEVIPYD